MKTNSSFLGVGGGYTVMIQNVGHTLLASYRAQPSSSEQTPGSSVFRGTKQLQRSPVIETNSIFLQLANFPRTTNARSISNEAFLNFPRIPTDRNYPFLEQNPPPFSLSHSHPTHRAFNFYLCFFPSLLSFFLFRPAFYTFSSILER